MKHPLLVAVGLAALVASYVLWFALEHNPQGRFYGSERGIEWSRRGMSSSFKKSRSIRKTMLVPKNAHEFIELFRQGKNLDDINEEKSIPNLMLGSQPDPKAMKILGEELTTGTQDVRLEIIYLIDRARYFTAFKRELRSPEFIALLIGPAFSKTDNARNVAMTMLSQFASPTTLSPYGDIFTMALKEEPTEYALLLAAKAKPADAWEEVDRLSQLPEWNIEGDPKRTAIRIARAALGDKDIEDEYIAELAREEHAGNAKKMAKTLFSLARIGTRSSLQAICQRMRSPLMTYDCPVTYKNSVRLEVIAALRYAFPERSDLDWERVTKDKDYIKVEQFCTQELGVNFEGIPRPAFFTFQSPPDNDLDCIN